MRFKFFTENDFFFFFSSRRRHTRSLCDWSSDVCSSDLAAVRSRKIGFVFQQFNLLPRTPAIEQVELPMVYAGLGDRRRRALEALEAVGLVDRAHHKPT